MAMRRLLAVLPLAAAAALAPTAHAAAGGSLAHVTAPTPIAAYGGWLAWSSQDATQPKLFDLMLRAPDGTVTRPAIAPRTVPFDVDLGPDVDGGVVAAYSRCTTEPDPDVSYPVPALYERGAGCAVYLLDIASGAERKATTVDAPGASEVWPSPWRGRIAFERIYARKPSSTYLYVGRYDQTAPSTRVPGGPRGTDTRSAASALELHGSSLAFAWSYQGSGEGLSTQIRLDTVGGGHDLVANRRGGGAETGVDLAWPAFDGGWLTWAQVCFGDPGGCPGRYGLYRRHAAGGAIQRAAGPRIVISADGAGAGATLALTGACFDTGAGSAGCDVTRLTPAYGR